MEILRIAEVEGEVWADAQLTIPVRQILVPQILNWRSLGHSRICLIDGGGKRMINSRARDGSVKPWDQKRK